MEKYDDPTFPKRYEAARKRVDSPFLPIVAGIGILLFVAAAILSLTSNIKPLIGIPAFLTGVLLLTGSSFYARHLGDIVDDLEDGVEENDCMRYHMNTIQEERG